MPITAGAACVASVVVAWPDPLVTTCRRYGDAADGGVGTLMVSTMRFPSSKQPKNALVFVILIAVNLALLAWLQTRFFAVLCVLRERDAVAQHRVAAGLARHLRRRRNTLTTTSSLRRQGHGLSELVEHRRQPRRRWPAHPAGPARFRSG
jgi:hypothetical protein